MIKHQIFVYPSFIQSHIIFLPTTTGMKYGDRIGYCVISETGMVRTRISQTFVASHFRSFTPYSFQALCVAAIPFTPLNPSCFVYVCFIILTMQVALIRMWCPTSKLIHFSSFLIVLQNIYPWFLMFAAYIIDSAYSFHWTCAGSPLFMVREDQVFRSKKLFPMSMETTPFF